MTEKISIDPNITSDDKLWALLSYIFTPIIPFLLMLIKVKKNRPFIKAHYPQALAFGIMAWVVYLVLSPILIVLVCVIWIAAFVFQIICAIKAFNGEYVNIPVITNLLINKGWMSITQTDEQQAIELNCPNCSSGSGKISIKTATVDRRTGKPAPILNLIGGIILSGFGAVSLWYGFDLLRNPIPGFSPAPICGPGFIALFGGLPLIINYLRADKVKKISYHCRNCDYKWSASEESTEPKEKDIRKVSDLDQFSEEISEKRKALEQKRENDQSQDLD